MRICLFSFLFFIVAKTSIATPVSDQDDSPEVHILMPLYNAEPYVSSAVQSVLDQDYPKCTLLIFDDGSTDESFKVVQSIFEKNNDKILLESAPYNRGIAQVRSKLLEWSRVRNPRAYIFWLDSDDLYSDKSFVRKVIQQMKRTNADICLFNFSIVYENEAQKINAQGLLRDKDNLASILDNIFLSPTQSVNPLQFDNILLRVSSLGWIKCYAPTVAPA
jgi:glycosyltransferase involved in cell wall biosynthesis